MWTMSRQPSSARWWTRLLPTMPAPITTTRALDGTGAMEAPPDQGTVLRIPQLIASLETRASMRLPRRACQPGTTGERWVLLPEPGLDLVGVRLDPLLGRV